MGDVTLTLGDIEDLAAKINELEASFDDRQRALLLANDTYVTSISWS